MTGILAVACLYTWLADYESFVQGLATATRHPGKLPQIRLLLPPERFFLIRILVTFAAGMAAALTVVLWQKTGQLAGAIRSAADLFVRPFLALWLLLWAAQVFIAFRLPFHVDERFTYLYFVREGWLVSMVYYPELMQPLIVSGSKH